MPGLIALSIHTIIVIFMSSSGLPITVVFYLFLSLVINVYLNWLLIPQYGLVGVSLASTIVYILMLLLSILFAKRHLKKILAHKKT